MQLKKGEEISLSIEKLAYGGAGIGYLQIDDKKLVVFVEGTLPQDEVTAKLKKIKPNYIEAELDEVTKESPLRVKPRCPHFDVCGGCSLQTLSYEEQLLSKELQVKESLEHIGGFVEPPMKKIIGCKDPWFYRNKMEFSFGTRDIDDDEVTVGLHPKHRRYDVFQVKTCFLETNDIGNLMTTVQKFVRKHKLTPYHFKSNTGLLRSITVREGKRTGKRLVNLLTSGEPFEQTDEFLKILTEDAKKNGYKEATSVYLTQQVIQKGRRTEFKEILLHGEKPLLETMILEDGSKLDFEILPMAFFQPNTLQAEILYDTALRLGDVSKKDIVFDLFCGTGTIGLFCAHKAKQVFGVDLNKNAIENAQNNAKTNNIKNVEFAVGDALKIVSERTEKPDIVIVDPPRNGLGEKLCEHLLEIKAPQIIYVSCNPTTLARDLKQLCEEAYTLETVQPVDMFPHTYHIETVCKLVYNH
ncbi:23S rRNA (uracil(1939)-C(5))-methyltransferase RlmD [Patescibacteria group bacterium]